MKRLLLSCLLLLVFVPLQAQRIPARNSIKLGADRVGLDAPDALALRYHVQYNRLLGSSRLKFGAKLGALRTEHESIVPTMNNRRIRQTLDLTLSFDLLKSPVHNIYPGFGFSIWRRNDTIVRQAEFVQRPDGTVDVRSFTTGGAQEINVGPYFSLEYEFRPQTNFSISAQIGFNDFEEAGINSNAGISVGYHF